MEDGQMLQQVRAIYVRNGVDTQFLQIDVTNKAVFVKGIFSASSFGIKKGTQKSPQEIAKIKDGTRRLLRQIEEQIIGIGEVKSLTFEYDNWMKSGGGWVEKTK
jgi:hypothetical protein